MGINGLKDLGFFWILKSKCSFVLIVGDFKKGNDFRMTGGCYNGIVKIY